MNIKSKDKVIVITGKDKGKEGKVLEVLPKKDQVVVEGLNLRKKHAKPRKQGQKGQIVEFPAPIDASNVMLLDPKTGKRTKIAKKRIKGKPVRIAKVSGQELK